MPSGEQLSEEFERFLTALGQEESWREQILHEDINDREDNFGRDALPTGQQETELPTEQQKGDKEGEDNGGAENNSGQFPGPAQ